MISFPHSQLSIGSQALMWSAPAARSETGSAHKLTPLEINHRVRRWLALCALDTPDSPTTLVVAAASDARSSSKLLKMLGMPAGQFRDWWYRQDHTVYRLSQATGSTDWAYMTLARISFEARNAAFAALPS